MKICEIVEPAVHPFFIGNCTDFPSNQQVLAYLGHIVRTSGISRSDAGLRIAKEVSQMDIVGVKSRRALQL